MEQLVLLLIIGAISLVNWLIQRSAELREKRKAERAAQAGETLVPPAPRAGPPPVQEVDPAESMRKLMEALGLPVDEPPPPRVPPALPKASDEVLPEPVRFEPEPELPVFTPPPPVERPLPRVQPSRFEAPLRTTPPAVVAERARPCSRFREILATPSGARDAIVLAEVLGRPLALRDGVSPSLRPGDRGFRG